MTTYTYDYLERNGRLGNQLWQIAWAYTQAIQNNGKVSIKKDWEYRPFFSVPDSMFKNPKGNIVDGQTEYFQDLSLWGDNADRVKQIFQPSDRAYFELMDYAEEILDYPIQTCSIHYRRGDYVKYPKHYPIPTDRYYIDAIRAVLHENPSTDFFVFSDDIEWVRNKCMQDTGLFKELYMTDQLHFMEGVARPVEVVDRKGEPLDWLDLFAMSLCNYHIIANSTFSWWGAFLSNKSNQTYYPSRWYGNHESVRHIPWRKAIPSGWTEIKC